MGKCFSPNRSSKSTDHKSASSRSTSLRCCSWIALHLHHVHLINIELSCALLLCIRLICSSCGAVRFVHSFCLNLSTSKIFNIQFFHWSRTKLYEAIVQLPDRVNNSRFQSFISKLCDCHGGDILKDEKGSTVLLEWSSYIMKQIAYFSLETYKLHIFPIWCITSCRGVSGPPLPGFVSIIVLSSCCCCTLPALHFKGAEIVSFTRRYHSRSSIFFVCG